MCAHTECVFEEWVRCMDVEWDQQSVPGTHGKGWGGWVWVGEKGCNPYALLGTTHM